MQINISNDPQSIGDVAFAADKLNRYCEHLAVGHCNARDGNPQRSCSVVISALAVALINTLHNMGRITGVEYTDADKDEVRAILQKAINVEVMKIIGRRPENGN